ncbi:MAG: AraC family ligand binding domain-containing protein [bacterium]|nr:AraC family ligand binding domain-containing protein [bacterium]MDE0419205.1 AraC family ligand binding domain-containing protein [bacterium]
MTMLQHFPAEGRTFSTLRAAGPGRQSVVDMVGSAEGLPFSGGIAELTSILIGDYEMTVDDFLVVIEGHARICCDGEKFTIGPGDAIFLPRGSIVDFEVPDRLVWSYACSPADSRAGLKQPGRLCHLAGADRN